MNWHALTTAILLTLGLGVWMASVMIVSDEVRWRFGLGWGVTAGLAVILLPFAVALTYYG